MNVGVWINGSKQEPIKMYSKKSDEIDLWDIENYPLDIDNNEFKLKEVAKIEHNKIPQGIAKENQQYKLCLQYNHTGSYLQSERVLNQAITSFNEMTPLGMESFQYWDNDSESNQYWLLFLIILIMFFTTSIFFNSLTQPFVIIFIIPISFIGLFLTFYLFKINFDQGGFAAFIILAGLSVNACIYVLSEYNNIIQSSV